MSKGEGGGKNSKQLTFYKNKMFLMFQAKTFLSIAQKVLEKAKQRQILTRKTGT